MLVTGLDIIEVSRIGDVAARYGERFFRRVYTQGEIDYCRGRAPQLASRFAAKEAVMKALGTGARGLRWRDIEVVRAPGRAPLIRLHGAALDRARMLGIDHVAVSLTHSRGHAAAVAVAESAAGNQAPWGSLRSRAGT